FADLRRCAAIDLVCLAETGQPRPRLAGGVLQSGIDRHRSRDCDVSPRDVVSAGECWIPQSIYAGAALRHGEPVAQIAWLWLWRELALLRLFLRHCRIPDLQIGLSSKDHRCFDADRGRVISDK